MLGHQPLASPEHHPHKKHTIRHPNPKHTRTHIENIHRNGIHAPQNHNVPLKKALNTLKKINKFKENMTSFVLSYYKPDDDDTLKQEPNMERCMCLDFDDGVNTRGVLHRCNNRRVGESHFCEKHANCMGKLRQFTSGSEPKYEPDKWGEPRIEGSHNCYSYFLDSRVQAVKEKCDEICTKKGANCPAENSECSELKPQPGDYNTIKATGINDDKENVYMCPNLEKKIMMDNGALIPIPFNRRCPKNYYKGAMVIDNNHTFHFYRQDASGLWSHKPGISPVSNLDASDRRIYIPHLADRNYARNKKRVPASINNDVYIENNGTDDGRILYDKFCGYYCIPANSYGNKDLV
jgi:hypothetical protein